MNSSDEENSVGSNDGGSRDDVSGRTQSENARMPMTQIGFGPTNSLSNIAQINTEAAAVAGEENPYQISPTSGERIVPDIFRNELHRAMDRLSQRATSTSSGLGLQIPMTMDISEQYSSSSSIADDLDIPSFYRNHAYAEQLRTMQQMGFLNHEENLDFLNLADGSIEQAVDLLLETMM